MEAHLEDLRCSVETRLAELFSGGDGAPSLLEAMRYSIAAGGKRVRPIVTLLFAQACGGEVTEDERRAVIDAAAAVELLHTYSLIHDDLPAMDDDDMRRGKPSNHIVFGQWRAILAGDALQAEAFALLANCGLPAERTARMVAALAAAAGAAGICGGQTLDMEGGAELDAVHAMKTASLIVAAAKIGVLAAGGSEAQLAAAEVYAQSIGMAFQIRDDVLDAIGDAQLLGKPVGSDELNGKTTYYTKYGAEKCEELIGKYTITAKNAVDEAFASSEMLNYLADTLVWRTL